MSLFTRALGSYRLKSVIEGLCGRTIHWIDKLPYLLGIKSAPYYPDLLLIGLPKCGTWWLAGALDRHPRLALVTNPWHDKGEVRFFSRNFSRPMIEYLNLFRNKPPNTLLFEKSPDYAILGASRIRLIRRVNPNVKLLLVFRDPIQRAISNAKMDLTRTRGIAIARDTDHLFYQHYESTAKIFNYEKILRQWQAAFDENLLVLDFRDIEQQPARLLDRIGAFLQLDFTEIGLEGLNKNETASAEIPRGHLEKIARYHSRDIRFYNEVIVPRYRLT